MGMILFPIFLGALLILIRTIFQLISLIKGNALSTEGIFLGVLIPILFIIFTSLSWIKKGKVYAFTPLFRYSFVLFYLPFILGLVVLIFKDNEFIRTTLFTWIVFSGLVFTPLYGQYSKLLKNKGVKNVY